MYKDVIVVYHKNCMDGLGGAYAAWVALGDNAEYLPFSYGMKFEDYTGKFKGKKVYLVDFSFKRSEFLKLLEIADFVDVIDHHKTAHDEIGDFVDIDLSKSGAVLAWEYFNPGKEIPQLLKHIQDRDLWKWELEGTNEISEYLYLVGFDLKDFIETVETTPVETMMEKGSVIVKLLSDEVTRVAEKARSVRLGVYLVPCVNALPSITSKLGNLLAKGNDFAMVYSDVGNERVFSLRSDKNGTDVADIARMFGGGGHPNSAGFSIPLNSYLLNNFMQEIKIPS